jgi:hypothetical protein
VHVGEIEAPGHVAPGRYLAEFVKETAEEEIEVVGVAESDADVLDLDFQFIRDRPSASRTISVTSPRPARESAD